MKSKSKSKSDIDNTKPAPQVPVQKKSAVYENLEAIMVAVVLALFIRTFVVQAFKIPSGSMEPTLLVGDHILVNKFIYGVKIPFVGKTLIPFKDPQRGDIVVFRFPQDESKDFIKRVIGVAGDRIDIKDKKVFVNGQPIKNDPGVYSDENIIPGRDQFSTTVPPNSLFVMGDNRDKSYDSRFWGFVDQSQVEGRAFIIYMSWNSRNHDGMLDFVRWDRLAQILR